MKFLKIAACTTNGGGSDVKIFKRFLFRHGTMSEHQQQQQQQQQQHPFNGPLSGTTRVSQYQKGTTNLNFKVGGSSISWDICKSALCPRQIPAPAPHHSIFYRPDALPATQPTASKH